VGPSAEAERVRNSRSRAATDKEIAALAGAAGIQPDWYEVDGTHHRVSPETQRALLAAVRMPAT